MAPHNHSHSGHSHAGHRPVPAPTFDLPIAALTAGWWVRLAALLPLIALLWAAIAWALGAD